jgi:hypothetical protein
MDHEHDGGSTPASNTAAWKVFFYVLIVPLGLVFLAAWLTG